MINAIHKESGKLVSVFLLEKDAEWLGREREEFIAPKPEIGNWNVLKEKKISEVKVSYVKAHLREYKSGKTFVGAHFRIECIDAIPNPLNESEEHLLSKEGIYEAILRNEITINGEPLSIIGEIEDINIEQKLSPSRNSVIADVLVKLKKEHPIYGRGIVFEIQFSHQNKEILSERTYSRVVEGYSVCWLYDSLFKNNELIKKDVEVIPFNKAIKNYQDKIKEEWVGDINNISQIYERKLNEIEFKIKTIEHSFDDKVEQTEEFLNQYKSGLYKQFDSFKEKINSYSLESSERYERNLLNVGNKKTYEIEETSKKYLEELNVLKEKIFKKIANDKELKEEIVKRINIPEISSQLASEIIETSTNNVVEGLKEIASNQVNTVVNELVGNKISFLKEIKERIDSEIIPEIKEKFGIIETDVFFKCSQCKKMKRVTCARITEDGLFCGTCFFELKDLKSSDWFQREVVNGKKN